MPAQPVAAALAPRHSHHALTIQGGSEPADLFAMGQAVLSSQPFSLLLGAELIKFSPEGTELRLPVSEQLKQQFGFIHGGVLAYLADNAMTFAGALSLGATAVATSEMKINYIRPALGGNVDRAGGGDERGARSIRRALRDLCGARRRRKAVRRGSGNHRGAGRQREELMRGRGRARAR